MGLPYSGLGFEYQVVQGLNTKHTIYTFIVKFCAKFLYGIGKKMENKQERAQVWPIFQKFCRIQTLVIGVYYFGFQTFTQYNY